MAGTGGDDTAFDGLADKGEIAKNVEELVSGRFVVERQRPVVDESQLVGVFVWGTYEVGNAVKLGLLYFLVVDDDGVVEVASLDEVVFQQRLYLSNEDEGARRSYFFGKVFHVFEAGILVVEYGRVEEYHRAYAEMVVGEGDDGGAALFVGDFYFVAYDVVVFLGRLLFNAYTSDVLDVYLCAAVENGKFRCVDLYEAVVDFRGIQGCHGVFDGADRNVVFAQHGTALGVRHIFGDSIDDGLAFEVGTLYFISVVFGSRQECDFNVEPRMQAFPTQGKAVFECLLFHLHISLSFE